MKTRVLVVDDSPLIRAVLREAFERTNDLVVVGEACDGYEAVDKVQILAPDVVTMDVLMPKMDGLAATHEIMRVRPTPILIVARDGGDARTLAVSALGHGALGVFPKPAKGFNEEVARELADMIRRVVRERQPVRFGASAPAERTRVLIVDDSPLVRELLRAALAQARDLVVVGEAGDGLTAVDMALRLDPDVVTLDLFMPMMDGEESAEKIARTCDAGILVVSQDAEAAARLLQRRPAFGAIELFVKPSAGWDDRNAVELAETIRRLAELARAKRGGRPSSHGHRNRVEYSGKVSVLGVVGSTGAPRVLREILAGLPKDFPVPIVLVQHTERGFKDTLVSWLGSVTALPVLLGTSGHVLVPGEIVVAPDDLHMEVHTGGILHLQAGEPVDNYRPSGTVLLASLARTFGAYTVGVVLSGMGTDGADGLGAIAAAGGYAVVEDPQSAAVPGMPKRALERVGDAFVERASRLAWLLIELAGSGRARSITSV
jgi:two-component system, chemotaxis family, protein-glutamate methylesterase/glutaminase